MHEPILPTKLLFSLHKYHNNLHKAALFQRVTLIKFNSPATFGQQILSQAIRFCTSRVITELLTKPQRVEASSTINNEDFKKVVAEVEISSFINGRFGNMRGEIYLMLLGCLI
ncbi:hypothetical protein K7X08_019407 [Anisodus acutangulus]|uniref:Uncharacterized protein n=1 Tax=Anisodus acutangulus TaxID=402998 RepID=A0A9Q1MSG6_9SOLA|nr:hypothetical protein K7X08_019407 [Anisodus acutangulus]